MVLYLSDDETPVTPTDERRLRDALDCGNTAMQRPASVFLRRRKDSGGEGFADPIAFAGLGESAKDRRRRSLPALVDIMPKKLVAASAPSGLMVVDRLSACVDCGAVNSEARSRLPAGDACHPKV